MDNITLPPCQQLPGQHISRVIALLEDRSGEELALWRSLRESGDVRYAPRLLCGVLDLVTRHETMWLHVKLNGSV